MTAPAPESAVEALQGAIIDLLRTAPALAELTAGRVYDEAPGDQDRPDPPYAYVAAVNKTRHELGCGAGWNVRMRFYVIGTDFGRVKLWKIIEIMTRLLDEFEPILDGPFRTHDRITVSQSGDVIEPTNPKSAFIDLVTIVGDA